MFRTCELQIMLIITSHASAFWITLILSFNFQKQLCLKFKQVFDLSCLMISDRQCSPNFLFLFLQQSLKQSDSKKTLSRWWRQRGRYAHRYWKNRGRLPLWTLIHTLSLRYSKSSMNLIQEVIQLKKKKTRKENNFAHGMIYDLISWFCLLVQDLCNAVSCKWKWRKAIREIS